MYAWLFAPPHAFPSGKVVVVSRGEDVPTIAAHLSEAHIVAHPRVLSLLLRLLGTATKVQAGAYSFTVPQSALTVAYRLSAGTYGISPARVTLLEGMTVQEYAGRVAAALPEITAEEVIAAGKSYEGYLYPDTYIFPPGADAETVVTAARTAFSAHLNPLLPDIAASGHTLSDVVIMASLIEREARTSESRRMVAGILWNRIKANMPLQVDAVFGYIFNRSTYSPSYADLKVASPYNTYIHTGLPPGPISNPGLDAIDAAIHPTPSLYLYYLTGRDGQMHYAKTYAEHQANQRKYLSSP